MELGFGCGAGFGIGLGLGCGAGPVGLGFVGPVGGVFGFVMMLTTTRTVPASARITIVDRKKLEAASCECYGTLKAKFDRLKL